MPIGATAGEARGLQHQHQTHFAGSHLGHQALKALATLRRGGRLALVLIE
jgi:hypothetical protein